VTTSARIANAMLAAPVSGSMPVISTSFNCSIQPRMPLSSVRSVSTSCSSTRMRASEAMRRTVA
jgi:hypothetical protein